MTTARFYCLKEIMWQVHSKLFGRDSQLTPATCQACHPAKRHQRYVTFHGHRQGTTVACRRLHYKVTLQWAHSWSLQQCGNRSPELPGSFPSWRRGNSQRRLCLHGLCGGHGMWLGCAGATLQLCVAPEFCCRAAPLWTFLSLLSLLLLFTTWGIGVTKVS